MANRDMDTLVMVFTVFRHGDRAPAYYPPNDPNKEHWPGGVGSLTNSGKSQAYELGKTYRKRYDQFLGSHYVADDVYVYSTDVDRCLMSAQCCLAGLFPPSEQNRWHPTLDWQPIPVHTQLVQLDQQAFNLGVTVAMEDLPSTFHADKHKKWYQNYIENKATYDKWKNFTSKDGPSHMGKVAVAMDTIAVEMRNKLSFEIPPDTDFMSDVKIILEAFVLTVETHPYYVKQGSELLTSVLKAMQGKIDGRKKTKMFMYSMHDFNQMSMMAQLDITLPRPEHGGAITFELHKLADDQYHVRVLQLVRFDSEPVDIQLNGQQTFCPLKTFEEMVKAAQFRAESFTKV